MQVDQRHKLFIAFSSEVDTGLREANASKQESGVDQRFHETVKDSSEWDHCAVPWRCGYPEK